MEEPLEEQGLYRDQHQRSGRWCLLFSAAFDVRKK